MPAGRSGESGVDVVLWIFGGKLALALMRPCYSIRYSQRNNFLDVFRGLRQLWLTPHEDITTGHTWAHGGFAMTASGVEGDVSNADAHVVEASWIGAQL